MLQRHLIPVVHTYFCCNVLKDVCGGMHITLTGSPLISYRSLKGVLDAKLFQVETIFAHLVFACDCQLLLTSLLISFSSFFRQLLSHLIHIKGIIISVLSVFIRT